MYSDSTADMEAVPVSDSEPPWWRGVGTHEQFDASSEMGGTAISVGGRQYHPRQVVAAALVVGGAIAIVVGWYGVSGTSQVWEQMPYFISGGIGGALLLALGLVTWTSYEHLLDRQCVAKLIREQRELEMGLAGEFDTLADALRRIEEAQGQAASTDPAANNGSASPHSVRRRSPK
jgi:hypothetical protein